MRGWGILTGILFLGLVVSSAFVPEPVHAQDVWELASPDGQVTLSVSLQARNEPGYPADKSRLYYKIDHGQGETRVEALPWSPLGVVRDKEDLTDGLVFDSKSDRLTFDEKYTIPHGKRSQYQNRGAKQSVTFRNAKGAKLEIQMRAYEDGAAFRYRFPESSNTTHTLTSEATGFRIPLGSSVWMQPYDDPTQYAPAYESFYVKTDAGTTSTKELGWAFPALVELKASKHWMLVTETADRTQCGTHLARQAPHGLYTVQFPDPREGKRKNTPTQPRSKLPWCTNWRVFILGDSLAPIVESTLLTNLNPPSILEGSTSWIRPGAVAWSWWSQQDSPRDMKAMLPFIDLAAEMNWKYFLVDAGWEKMQNGSLNELAAYAKRKNVDLILWYASSDRRMSRQEERRREFERIQDLGVRGIKVDFFVTDKQYAMQLYQDILIDAATYRLMVNFHGCTLPRGWTRTYPHLMTQEAVSGAESYIFFKTFPDIAPYHSTVLPFTRNAVGPMDYTPVTFSDNYHAHKTTNAHELALSVVFESGWQHFADRVSAYRDLPQAAKDFLRSVPTAWDETRYAAGEPGEYAVIARRKGDQWYVGAINGRKEPREIVFTPHFLETREYNTQVIGDGATSRTLQVGLSKIADPTVPLQFTLAGFGGLAMQITPVPPPKDTAPAPTALNKPTPAGKTARP
ncbi:MAG TPA: glycoside hydrolase family 97 catalytic domain-containing protein [Candidatus Sumerlaeota bacterium]|nr:glycoside hydrolase family 97 catalytic domain-containing protein [Candidatus Sumerlaeota bacterium]